MNAILVYSNDIDILIESVALASLSSYEDQLFIVKALEYFNRKQTTGY